jgi:DinB family protein
MRSTDVLLDAFGRVHELIPALLDGLTVDDVLWRPDPQANSIGWLLWHLTRVEDDHLAGVAGSEQVWTNQGWSTRFGLPYDERAHGFGMSPEQVGAFSISDLSLLSGYSSAVGERSRAVLDALTDADLDRVIDTRWDPPLTVAVRLVSVADEIAQHAGQAGYIRGLRERAVGRRSEWAGYPA